MYLTQLWTGNSQLVGAKADVWSTGVVLYFLLSGFEAFALEEDEELLDDSEAYLDTNMM